ncbi:MAG TPA: hypothetical protein DCO75_01300 [Fibrobacteres bacterium]|nr:hypothetical protein [Fibrobacterota bacterium]
MSKKIPIYHYIEYLFLRSLESIMILLPRKLSLALGALCGDMLRIMGVYRSVVNKNMDYAGLFDKKRKKVIIKKLYLNIGRLFADFLRPSDIPPPYSVENIDIAKTVFSRGKGSIVVLAHFGNWEALASVFGMQFYDLNVLAKPMKNLLIEKWLSAKRLKAHVTPVYPAQALRKLLTIIKRGGIIAMLIDQYAGTNGTPAPFLGKTANTVRTVAGLLHKTDCGIIFAYALLQKNGVYDIHIEEGPSLPISRDEHDAFITAYQAAHNDVLSRWITGNPEYYFGWFHRRFKGRISY